MKVELVISITLLCRNMMKIIVRKFVNRQMKIRNMVISIMWCNCKKHPFSRKQKEVLTTRNSLIKRVRIHCVMMTFC